VSIFGQNFLATGSNNTGVVPLPGQLGPQNTTLPACGQAFPLYSVFPGQINAQIPLEYPATGVVTATITVGGQAGTQTFALAPASPGVFTEAGSGVGNRVIAHADYLLVGAAKRASTGEEVVIYATGSVRPIRHLRQDSPRIK